MLVTTAAQIDQITGYSIYKQTLMYKASCGTLNTTFHWASSSSIQLFDNVWADTQKQSLLWHPQYHIPLGFLFLYTII